MNAVEEAPVGILELHQRIANLSMVSDVSESSRVSVHDGLEAELTSQVEKGLSFCNKFLLAIVIIMREKLVYNDEYIWEYFLKMIPDDSAASIDISRIG